MQNLSKLFDDFFDDKEITNNRLITFGNDHLSRLSANNPASVYAAIITATTTALTNLSSVIVVHDSSEGTREGSTVTKKGAHKALTEYISMKEGLIKSVFGKTSSQYQEFFPRGLAEFYHGTEMEYDTETKVFVEKAVKYQDDLGNAFVVELTNLFNTWHNAYTTQNDDTVVTDNSAGNVAAAAKVLRLQLTKNSLFVAYNNVDSTTAFELYFDITLLFPQHRTHIYKGVASENSTSKVHDIMYSSGKHFILKNKGAVELSFQLWLGNTPVGNSFTVAPSLVLEKAYTDFFSNGDSLRVTNASTTIDGIYEVRDIS